jgi:hypothetical protein
VFLIVVVHGFCSVAAAASNIAGDMDSSAPDVRDRAPEERRAEISGAFAQVLSLQTAIQLP